MAERAEEVLRESQCGFCKDWVGVDQICSLRVLVEKAREFNTPLYHAFVDLRTAYKLVNREPLWVVLEKWYHLPDKILCILRALNDGTVGAVREYGKVSGEFYTTSGVWQGMC